MCFLYINVRPGQVQRWSFSGMVSGRRLIQMRDIRTASPKGDQSCPICGAKLAPGALMGESYGTDLPKSGVRFGRTEIRPATLRRQRRSPKLSKPPLPNAGEPRARRAV